MKKSSKQIVKRALTILVLLALFASGIYAWIYGNVTPEITGDFQIGTMSGLKFMISSTSTDLINLNEAFGIATDSLNLNEVSSADGKTFLARDTAKLFLESGNPAGEQEIITFRTAADNEVIETQVNDSTVRYISGDYMDVSFQMLLDYSDDDPADYYIYFLNGVLDGAAYSCGFTGGENAETTQNGLQALRTCLRVSGATSYGSEMVQDRADASTYYAFFANNSELGTTESPYHTHAVKAPETVNLKLSNDAASEAKSIAGSYYINYLSGISQWPHTFGTLTTVDVNSFASCSINPGSTVLNNHLTGTSVPNNNYLFKMDSQNHSVTITMRVWLEGGSDYCINGQIVPEDAVKLNLYFVAYKIPVVS